jgi:hypothetical protein
MTKQKQKCSKCDCDKFIDEFYKGVRQCKQCVKERCKKYKQKNKESLKIKKKIWDKSYKNRLDKKPLLMLRRARNRAKKNNIPFNLTIEDIVIPKVCPILGIPLFHEKGGVTDNTPSLDKIIPSLGYIKGNVAVISWKANLMKSDLSIEILQNIINYIQKYKN